MPLCNKLLVQILPSSHLLGSSGKPPPAHGPTSLCIPTVARIGGELLQGDHMIFHGRAVQLLQSPNLVQLCLPNSPGRQTGFPSTIVCSYCKRLVHAKQCEATCDEAIVQEIVARKIEDNQCIASSIVLAFVASLHAAHQLMRPLWGAR